MQFYARVYRVQSEVVVAACDRNVHGKSFEEGNLVLYVKKEFYGDELVGEEEVSSLLARATIANLVGEKIVAHAIKIGIIDSQNVLRVKGVPHAQMARM
ncbi:MAG: DUF424 family protein [Candidatus Thermoplasmatota archaeon]|nr:DUF424 family protein [Candidatus Thermoplasmatota archaeon]